MIVPIIAVIVGLAIGGRSKPLSRQSKMKMLGPKTGTHYEVEDLPDSGIVVVHAPDGTNATFERPASVEPGQASTLSGTSPLKFKMARGNKGTILLMRQDFEKDFDAATDSKPEVKPEAKPNGSTKETRPS